MKVIHKEREQLKNSIPEYARALKLRRKRLGYTQKELAKQMSISPMGLSHFEVGVRSPNLKWMEKWANCLDAEIKLEIIDIKLFNRK